MQSDQIRDLAGEIYRDRVLRARQMPPEQKLLAGEELFHTACAITAAGIRQDHPEYSESEVLAEIRSRLKIRERLEQRHVR